MFRSAQGTNAWRLKEQGRGDSIEDDSWRTGEKPTAWTAVAGEEQWRTERERRKPGRDFVGGPACHSVILLSVRSAITPDS